MVRPVLTDSGCVQLVPLEPERQVAVRERLADGARGERLVRALVPDDHRALAVAGTDPALEVAVAERVVLDLDGEPLLARVGRRALRDRPGLQDSVGLEPEVVVQRARRVLLDHEPRHAVRSTRARR
jgi:hypothetical protein